MYVCLAFNKCSLVRWRCSIASSIDFSVKNWLLALVRSDGTRVSSVCALDMKVPKKTLFMTFSEKNFYGHSPAVACPRNHYRRLDRLYKMVELETAY